MLQLTFPEEPFVLALVAVMFGIIFGFVAVVVYLEHRKEMALIESGQYPVDTDTRAWVLAGGLLALAVGVGQLVVTLANRGAVGPGVVLALVGVAALVYYFVKRRQERRNGA
jgi:uncharacterized membrane protein HdeD (DUF308 family)